MAMSDLNLLLHSPSKVIENIYEENPGILHNLDEVGMHFKNVLNNNFARIPCINEMSLEKIRAKSLVRYRGMIQDMFDPEFYLGTFETLNKRTNEKVQRIGCYTDCNESQDEEIDFKSEKNVTLERQTYYCVPVPGENIWVKNLIASHNDVIISSVSTIRSKREHDDMMEEDGVMEDECVSKYEKVQSMNGDTCQKKAKTDNLNNLDAASKTKSDVQTEFLKNFPFPGEDGPGCFVKMYSQHSELKLNDVCEFICILSVDPILATSSLANGDDGENSVEEKAHCPPPSIVPRLHCLFLKKIETLNPSIWLKDALYDSVSKELCSIRGDLLQLLSNIFGGDAVLAEFFLFHLISRVYGRCGAMCIGKMSLNVMNCPSGTFTEILYNFLQSIVEKSHYVPLTLANLNKGKFIPKKDYDANRLISGQLQLPTDFQLVLDETKMQNGQLDSDGVHNLTAIGNLIQWQKVEYDFKFHKLNMDTNVNVLVLSEGKSMLTCDCQIPMKVSDEISEEKTRNLLSELSEKLLERIRLYLTIVRRLEYNLTDEIQKALQDDFVEMRKQDSLINADSFYLLLTTARYMALSYGQTTLSSSLWIRTKELDSARRKRMVKL